MYYELERKLSKSTLSFDKQEQLAQQLVDLIDRKMRERAPSNILSSEIQAAFEQSPQSFSLNPRKINHLLEATKLHQGLAITNNIKQEKVPSIPFEPRKEETIEKVGPGTYNPNMDSVMKKLPTLAVIKKKQNARPVPKKALESFINTIFSTPAPASPEPEGTLTKERSHTTLKKQVRHGKALF